MVSFICDLDWILFVALVSQSHCIRTVILVKSMCYTQIFEASLNKSNAEHLHLMQQIKSTTRQSSVITTSFGRHLFGSHPNVTHNDVQISSVGGLGLFYTLFR